MVACFARLRAGLPKQQSLPSFAVLVPGDVCLDALFFQLGLDAAPQWRVRDLRQPERFCAEFVRRDGDVARRPVGVDGRFVDSLQALVTWR